VPLANDEYVVVLPKKHPLVKQQAVSADQLHEQPFIVSSAGCGDEIASILERAGARPRELFRLPQVLSVLGLVEQGLGLSVSVRLALPERWPGVVYRSFKPSAPRQIALAMLDRNQLSLAAKAFVEIASRARNATDASSR
jgi:DNA-binding transcriptional LysR family regulator